MANATLDRVQQLFDGRRYREAHDIALEWIKANPKAPDRDRGILLLAETYYVNGDRMWCFYECDELIENYPDSKLFFAALELQYRVADAFLSGYRKKFLGLAVVPMEDTGIEMLFRVQERSPGSPIAEKSLLRTARYYYQSSQFDLAADAYGAFIRIYPRSPEVGRVRLRQAHANFAQYHGPRYDATPLLDARAQFAEVQTRHARPRPPGWRRSIDRTHRRRTGGQDFVRRRLLSRRPRFPGGGVSVSLGDSALSQLA